MLYFRNIALSDVSILELIRPYPQQDANAGSRKMLQRFQVVRDIGPAQPEWFLAFMGHLRKQVLLTAAYHRARVAEVRFSYPDTFSPEDLLGYQYLLERAWSPYRVEIQVKDEAIRNAVVRAWDEYVVLDAGPDPCLRAYAFGGALFRVPFPCAEGLLGAYVVSSVRFRQAFIQAMEAVVGTWFIQPRIAQVFRQAAGSGQETMLTTLWFSLLQSIEDNAKAGSLDIILQTLRQQARDTQEVAARRAIQGFFLSAVLQLGGMAYYAGLLLREAARGTFGKAFEPMKIHLCLTSGSHALYRMLDAPEVPFHPVLTALFKAGLANQAAYVVAEEAFLPSVGAEGLLALRPDLDLPAYIPPLVPDLVGEEIGMRRFTDSLVAFYQQIGPNGQFTAPDTIPPILAQFLDELHRLLPAGFNRRDGQKGLAVIPMLGDGWHAPLKGDLYARARNEIRNRVRRNANKLAKDRQATGDVGLPSQEPLFMVELWSLLEVIRETYGKGRP
jgi:hypothetical protein